MRRIALAGVVAMIAVTIVLAGCGNAGVVNMPGSTDKVTSTAGGGVRAVQSRGGELQLSAEVSTTTVLASRGIAVRVTLKNTSSAPFRWDAMTLGWYASVSGRADHVSRASVGVSDSGDWTMPKGGPLTLAPGESTTTVASSGPIEPGTYRVRAAYAGLNGTYNSDSAPDITIRVVSK